MSRKAHIYRSILMHNNAKKSHTLNLSSFPLPTQHSPRFHTLGERDRLERSSITVSDQVGFSFVCLARAASCLYLLAANICCALGIHEQGNDQTVETKDFGENKNQDHADEESGLLGCAADTCVTDDTDCEAGKVRVSEMCLVCLRLRRFSVDYIPSSKTSQSDTKTCT